MALTHAELSEKKFSEVLKIAEEHGVTYKGQKRNVLEDEIVVASGGESALEAQNSALNVENDARKKISGTMVAIKGAYADLEPAKYRETSEMNELIQSIAAEGAISPEDLEKLYTDVLNAFCSPKKKKGRTKEEMAELRAKRQPKEKKEKAPKEKKVRVSSDVEVTAEMTAVIENADLSKSEKMRRLFDLGMPVNQIAKTVNAVYAFVYNTIAQYRLKKSASAVEAASTVSATEVSDEVTA